MVLELVKELMHNPVRNYIIPGFTSYLVSETDEYLYRAFHMEREQVQLIVPHSHRFNLLSKVIRGSVQNTLWREVDEICDGAELFTKTQFKYLNEFGKYELGASCQCFYEPITCLYIRGDEYYMRHDQIHSITFEKDSLVLIREDKLDRVDHSHIIEPFHPQHGTTNIFKLEYWMFKNG